jgi:hypothetical protein
VARAAPSPSPTASFRGYIRVDNAGTGANIGFVSKNPIGTGQMQIQPLENALVVDFGTPIGALSTSQIDVTMGVGIF